MHSDLRTKNDGPARPPQPDAAALARRDRRIAQLAEALEAALAERDSLAQAMQARFRELALVTTLAERYRAAADRSEPLKTGPLQEELKRLNEVIERHRTAAERASAREDELIRLRDALEAEADARRVAEAHAEAFEASLSWRITAPLRRLRSLPGREAG